MLFCPTHRLESIVIFKGMYKKITIALPIRKRFINLKRKKDNYQRGRRGIISVIKGNYFEHIILIFGAIL